MLKVLEVQRICIIVVNDREWPVTQCQILIFPSETSQPTSDHAQPEKTFPNAHLITSQFKNAINGVSPFHRPWT